MPNSTPQSTVKLDPAAQVAMDPNAKVKIADLPAMPYPTRDQLKPDATAALASTAGADELHRVQDGEMGRRARW